MNERRREQANKADSRFTANEQNSMLGNTIVKKWLELAMISRLSKLFFVLYAGYLAVARTIN